MADRLSRSDMRTIAMAARQRWPVSDEVRIKSIDSLHQVLADPLSSNRDKIAATKALVAMDGLNIKDERVSGLQLDRNRFLEIAANLGIAHHLADIPGIGTGSDSGGIDATPGGFSPGNAGATEASEEQGS